MKVHVNSFSLDINAMLNQLNSRNGLSNANAIIKKAWNDTQQKFNQATENINNVYNQYHKDLSNSEQSINQSFSQKLKTHSDEFLNRLLQQENNFKDFQNKDTSQKLALAKKIDTAHDNIVNFVNGQHFETPQQLNANYKQLWGNISFRGRTINGPKDMANAIWDEDHYIAQQMAARTQANKQFVSEEINDTMSGAVQNQFNNMRTQMPHNFMEYMPPGQFPATAQIGDICWQASDYGFNTNAQAFQYDGSHWQPLKTQLNLYASNIYSPNINGGNITGAQFLSQYHGRDGKSLFSVDTQGNIYANNLQMDLDTSGTGSGINGYTYNADNDDAKGLSFSGGVMSMKAIANQVSGKFVRGYNGAVGGYNDADYIGDFNAQTYIQPDYIKLRAGTLGDGDVETNQSNGESEQVGALLARTDLRAGNLELSDEWGQNYGVRLGYWNNDNSNNPQSSGDVGPLLAIENGVKLGYKYNSTNPEFDLANWIFYENNHGALQIASNDNNIRELDIDNPVHINSGDFRVDGQLLVKGNDYNQDISSIRHDHNDSANELHEHQQWLQNHEQILTIGGNTLSGKSTRLDTHDTRLDKHDNELSNHDRRITQNTSDISNLGNKIAGLQSNATNAYEMQQSINNLNTKVDSENWEMHHSGLDDGTINMANNDIWSTYQTGDNGTMFGIGDVFFHNNNGGIDSGPVGIHAGDVYSHGNLISSDYSVKKNITNVDPKKAFIEILNTDIKSWQYKNDNNESRKNIGPIIDDVHNNKDQKFYTPNDLIHHTSSGDSFILNNAISYLILSIQELQKQNSQLTQRVAKLEFQK